MLILYTYGKIPHQKNEGSMKEHFITLEKH